MTSLTNSEINTILQRFPKIELSYETIPHKKVSPKYNCCLAIPNGKKVFVWFTFFGHDEVCLVMDLNKEKRITTVNILHTGIPIDLAKGTVLYGTVLENGTIIVEDIFFYCGVPQKGLFFGEKLGFTELFFEKISADSRLKNGFKLPILWATTSSTTTNSSSKNSDYMCEYIIPEKWELGYTVNHIQYRCLSDLAPFLNVFPVRKGFNKRNDLQNSESLKPNTLQQNKEASCLPLLKGDSNVKDTFVPWKMDFFKPQYKQTTVFQVSADIQYDIYHLYAYGKGRELVYYNVLHIPNFAKSVFMNRIFRNIRENGNLDAIEESDDEDDFEDLSYDKYVDLKKVVFIECKFNMKFKKWVPMQVVDSRKVVHIGQL